MKPLPQIRLRTLFLIFFCAAVGLTIGTQSSAQPGQTPLSLRDMLHLDWHYALFAAGSAAMVIGLILQIAQLRRLTTHAGPGIEGFKTARRFAIAWRIAIAGIVTLCLAAVFLIRRQLIQLPDSEHFVVNLFPFSVWAVAIVVSLLTSTTRLSSPRKTAKLSRTVGVILWFAVALLLIFMLPNNTLVIYLVHIATAGIEKAQPLIYQRSGEFPDHDAGGFRVYWISTATVGFVLLSLASLLALCNADLTARRTRLLAALIFVVSIMVLAAYCLWYYLLALPYISPYFAEVGLASNYLEQLSGICLALILITAGGYRLVTARSAPSVANHNAALPVGMHESGLCLATFLVGSTIYIAQIFFIAYSNPGTVFRRTGLPRLVDAFGELLLDPPSLLILLTAFLSARLIWLRWRLPEDCMKLRLAPLDARRFAWSWVAISAWTLVAVPTLSSYSFLFWLGPWYLYG